MTDALFPSALVQALRPTYRLDWDGLHGWSHWMRVRENGLRLAESTGADWDVVVLFALFHDIARVNDGHDPEHGRRAAEVVRRMAAELDGFNGERLELLVRACAGHADGLTTDEATVGTCWDADRLDLGRVGTRPRGDRLCTDAARDPVVLDWAWRRSRGEG